MCGPFDVISRAPGRSGNGNGFGTVAPTQSHERNQPDTSGFRRPIDAYSIWSRPHSSLALHATSVSTTRFYPKGKIT